jgi:LysM repeat protein
MKHSLRFLFTAPVLAMVFLTGCATSRPPRNVGGGTVPPVQNRPDSATSGVVMPPRPPSGGSGAQAELIEVVPMDPIPSTPAVAPAPAPRNIEPKSGTPYTIKKGETLSGIAARNRMSWKKLAEYNLINNPNTIRAGQVILIPDGGSAPVSRTASRPAPAAVSGRETYVVQSGDSLSVIAVRYGTTVKALKEVNNLISDKLLVGQVLKLPKGAEASGGSSPSDSSNSSGSSTPAPRPTPVATRPIPPRPTATPAPREDPEAEQSGNDVDSVLEGINMIDKPYPIIVGEGDTLQSIAENYFVTVEEVRKLNNLKEGEEVKPGQELLMPATLY